MNFISTLIQDAMLAPPQKRRKMIKIKCAKDELLKLKRRMLKAYPKERLEVVWGKKINQYEYHIYVFDTIEQRATTKSVAYEPSDYLLSKECAEQAGLIVLGTIHSHPDCLDATPSECDYDNSLRMGEYISGIALININPITLRRNIRVKFWGPLSQVEPEYL